MILCREEVMVLVCAQRDAIEGILGQLEGIPDQPPGVELKPTVQLHGGKELHLWGISEGTGGRGTRWQSVHVAVFGEVPPERDPDLPNGMKIDGTSLVHAAVLVDNPSDPVAGNEHRVTLITKDGDHVELNGEPRRYLSTIC